MGLNLDLFPQEYNGPGRVNIDPATEALVNDQYQRAISGENPYAETAKQAGLISEGFAGPKASGLTGQSGMGQAIASKYGSIGQQEIDNLKRVQGLGEKEQSFKRTGLAMHSLQIKQQAEIAAGEKVMQYQMQEAATRQAAINAIWGFGTGMMGNYMGGIQAGQSANDSMRNAQANQNMRSGKTPTGYKPGGASDMGIGE